MYWRSSYLFDKISTLLFERWWYGTIKVHCVQFLQSQSKNNKSIVELWNWVYIWKNVPVKYKKVSEIHWSLRHIHTRPPKCIEHWTILKMKYGNKLFNECIYKCAHMIHNIIYRRMHGWNFFRFFSLQVFQLVLYSQTWIWDEPSVQYGNLNFLPQ